jgi:hypothetical protein
MHKKPSPPKTPIGPFRGWRDRVDITSPTILKLKGGLFCVLGLFSAVLLLLPKFRILDIILYGTSVWGFCRAYYFGFYVLHHYVDPSFKFTGILSILVYLFRNTDKKAV